MPGLSQRCYPFVRNVRDLASFGLAFVTLLSPALVQAQGEFVSYDEKNRTTPFALVMVSPDYPAAFKDQRLEGYVDLEFGLRPDGTVTSPTIVATALPEPFSLETLDVTRFWVFRVFPYGRDCKGPDPESQRYLLRLWFEWDADRPRISISQPAQSGPPGTPRIVSRVKPEFPSRAARAGIAYGCVFVKVHVTETGAVKETEIVESKPSRVFDGATVAALSQYRWEATGTDSSKVTNTFTFQLNFILVDR